MSDKSTPSPPGSPKATHQAVDLVKGDSKQARKRGREGSLEPTGSAQDSQASSSTSSTSSAPVPLPKKKNRIVDDSRGGPSPDLDDKTPVVENSREKELRQGVEDLEVGKEKAKMGGVESVSSSATTEEEDASLPPASSSAPVDGEPTAAEEEEMRSNTPTPVESGLVPSTDPDDTTTDLKAAAMDDDAKTTISTTATIDSNEDISISAVATPVATPQGEAPPSLGAPSSDMMDADGILGAAGAPVVGGGEKGLKRKHVVGSESSLLGRSESYSTETKKVKEDEPVASTSTLPKPTTKPIATGGFSSFAAKSSPFVSRPPPTSGTSTPFGSNPPSTTTSPTISSASTMPSTSSTNAVLSSSKPNVPTFSSFSNSTGASPFSSGTKHTSSPSPFAGSNVFSSFATASPFKPKPATGASFGDILSGGSAGTTEDEKSGEDGEAEAEGSSSKEGASEEPESGDGAAKIPSEDMVTGEEGEDTRHQVRAKLHVIEEKNGPWKERGTGLCKLNYNPETKKTRLIMRADGVFRLILNVALFEGMSCERQDKFVRLIAFENGSTLQVALRLGTVKGAEDLFDHIQRLIPKPPAKLNYAMKSDPKAGDEADGWGV